MLIAPPLAYDEIIKMIPAGIFINIAAKASIERGTDQTPYWRTLKKDGELNEKYPEGIDGQKLHLEMEEHTIIQKGKRYFVKDYKEKFFELEH